MTMKTHVSCTVAAYSAIAVHCTSHNIDFMGMNDYLVMGIGFLPMIGASIFPDIDIDNSRASNRFPLFKWLLKHRTITHEVAISLSALLAIVFRNANQNLLPVVAGVFFAFMPLFFMKVPKNILVAVLTGIAAFYATSYFPLFGQSVVVGFVLGWLLHIVEDSFNGKGVYVFHAKISLARIKTRTWQETTFMIVWIGGCILWILQNLGLISVMDLFQNLMR